MIVNRLQIFLVWAKAQSSLLWNVKTPGPDWEGSPLSIVSKESPPKQRCSRSISRLLTVLLAYPACSLLGSCRQSNSSPIVGVLVDVVASNCCSQGQFKSGHFSEERSCGTTLMICLRSNVSSKKNIYIFVTFGGLLHSSLLINGSRMTKF